MQMAKVSALTKQLNSLTLAELAQKQEIVRQLFGSAGSNPLGYRQGHDAYHRRHQGTSCH